MSFIEAFEIRLRDLFAQSMRQLYEHVNRFELRINKSLQTLQVPKLGNSFIKLIHLQADTVALVLDTLVIPTPTILIIKEKKET